MSFRASQSKPFWEMSLPADDQKVMAAVVLVVTLVCLTGLIVRWYLSRREYQRRRR